MKGYINRRYITVFLASAATLMATPAWAERIFYIDFDNGNDAADGLSPATAWKRAPGDSKAESKPKATKLQAGDTLRFRGGVRYRGSILVRTKGTKENPIVLDGSAWGSAKAVIDGSDPLPMPTRCRSAAECLDAPQLAPIDESGSSGGCGVGQLAVFQRQGHAACPMAQCGFLGL